MNVRSAWWNLKLDLGPIVGPLLFAAGGAAIVPLFFPWDPACAVFAAINGFIFLGLGAIGSKGDSPEAKRLRATPGYRKVFNCVICGGVILWGLLLVFCSLTQIPLGHALVGLSGLLGAIACLVGHFVFWRAVVVAVKHRSAKLVETP